MRTIIAGSRHIWDYAWLEKAIFHAEHHRTPIHITSVICGMAPGVDSVGWAWATVNQIPIIEVPAQWELFGKKAGPLRNLEMIKQAEALVFIWDGQSPGTKHMLNLARRANLKIYGERSQREPVETH